MNPFDAVVLGVALVGLVTGYAAGLLRSLATILAYVIAAPVALAVSPAIVNWLNTRALLPADKAPLLLSLVPFVALIVIAVLLGTLDARRGRQRDRWANHVHRSRAGRPARPGAHRPAGRAAGADLRAHHPGGPRAAVAEELQLRPYLSAAGAQGLRALPPEITRYIDEAATPARPLRTGTAAPRKRLSSKDAKNTDHRPHLARPHHARQADEYAKYLVRDRHQPLEQKALAVQQLREDRDTETEFITISYWENVEAMSRFTGAIRARSIICRATRNS